MWRIGLLGFLGILLGARATGQPPMIVQPPPRIYTIQCGRFSQASEADLCESRVRAQAFGPVWRVNEAGRILVCVGKFDTNSEAWAIAQQLKKAGILEFSVQSFPNAPGEDFESEYASPEAPLLIAKTPAFSPTGTVSLESDPRAAAFCAALANHDRAEIIDSGRALIDSLADSEPIKSRVMVESARSLIQRENESAPGLPYLLKVAQGGVAASGEDLIEARFMVADSWHYYWFAPLKAYRAYKEILAAHGDNPGVQARCRVEMAACLLELARMPDREWKASFEDARRQCARILRDLPAEWVRARAVADLMYCESYLYEAEDPRYSGEGNKQARLALLSQSLAAFEGFADRYPGRIREVAMSKIMMASLSGELGDWTRCRSLYEDVLGMDFSDPRENFYWKGEKWNLPERAAKWLVHYARQFNDDETRTLYEGKLAAGEYEAGAAVEDASFDFAFPHEYYQQSK